MWADVEIVVAVLVLSVLAGCALTERGTDGRAEAWVLHTKQHPDYTYRIEYPRGWKVEEEGSATHFLPPGDSLTAGRITVVVIDEDETPPPPVFVTYTTVRIIESEGRAVPVQHRDPAAATERYLVRLQQKRFATEIRFTLSPGHESEEAYDAVFDHMVLSYTLSIQHP